MITQFIKSAQIWESALFCWCLSRKHASEIAKASRLVSHIGDGHLYAVLGIIAYASDNEYGSRFLTAGLLAFAIELPIYFALKNLIKRDRPNVAIDHITAYIIPSDKFSFPSGHSAAAFLMAVIISYYYPEFAPICFIYASLIGVSRVLLGVHYPSDILAGACLGSVSAYLGINFISTL